MKKLVFLLTVIAGSFTTHAQFSFATDLSEVRNFGNQQKFWAVGQTVQGLFHVSGKEEVYGWFNFFGNGRFRNVDYAKAKNASTFPQTVSYSVTSWWRYHEFSVGWKHYFKGSSNADEGLNIYGLAGFGLLTTKVHNEFNPEPDTTVYKIQPPFEGDGIFRKLSFDLGMGAEWPLGGGIYIYADARTWLPTSAYPSRYMQNTDRTIPVIVSGGLRISFGLDYY